jgi:hypothetical protein
MTITGGPGFGKTRLTVELGHSLLGSYPGGVWFAALADARSVEDVSATIAAATVIHDEVTGMHAVARALASRHILLILDGCEHVLVPGEHQHHMGQDPAPIMNRRARTVPPDRVGQRLADTEPVSKHAQSMQPDMADNLAPARFHDHAAGAGGVHLGDALLSRKLMS